jgi:predicted nucleotidyltransferase component of viral defense system
MTYAREHHRSIAAVLGILDAEQLRTRHCYFAGGTALALLYGEYRESVDIDFIVADPHNYRDLAHACRTRGFDAITVPGQRVVQADSVRTDQYGIRTRLKVSGVSIKFEIVREGRIALDQPRATDTILGIATAALGDLVATKLLANCDRWSDRSVYSRDIIDLAMIAAPRRQLKDGMRKARMEYRDAVLNDAQAAIASLLERRGAIDSCRQALAITMPPAVVVDRLRRLSTALTKAWAALSTE